MIQRRDAHDANRRQNEAVVDLRETAVKMNRTPAAGSLGSGGLPSRGTEASGSHTNPQAPGREPHGQGPHATVERRRNRELRSPDQTLREAQDFLNERQIGPII